MMFTSLFAQGKKQAQARLVFNRYGTTYFTSKVWSGLGSKGQELMKSKAEKEYSQRASIPKTVDVALSIR